MSAHPPSLKALEQDRPFQADVLGKETENEPPVSCQGRALKRDAERSTVVILDDDLIVGLPSSWLGADKLTPGDPT